MKIPSLHIILVHGLWGNAGHWDGVISALGAWGYTSSSLRALDLSLDSLARATARLQTEISRAPAPVLLVGHSYGGAVISQATDPKVRGVAYVAGLALDEGESLAAIQAQYPPQAVDAVEVDGAGYAWVKADKFQDAFCAELSPAALFPSLVGQHVPRTTVFLENVTTPVWKKKPAWYLISTKDHTLSPAAQEMMAARAHAKTLRLDTCHASLLSRPREVAAFIVLAARAVSA